MSTKFWQRVFSFFVLAGLLLSLARPGVGQAKAAVKPVAAPAVQEDPLAKIEKQVLDELAAKGQTDFFIILKAQADLSSAAKLATKVQKGTFVYDTLRNTADSTQKDLRTYLDQQGAKYTSYYVANTILVRGGSQNLLMAVAKRPDVKSVTANHAIQLEKPFIKDVGPQAPAAVESNLIFVKAPDVWALGITGSGVVLAGNDTGLQWDHPAIINHYRGWDGTTADHNYNWWDATGTYPNAPGDGHGHGTHTTGTMVGDDGGANQIGMAPGAQTIHCKNMTDGGSGSDSTFLTCFQFDLAPWDLTGSTPRPDLAPDAVNNSWGYGGGGVEVFRIAINNLQAAGTLVEVSAGNEGPGCSTLRSPGDYENVLTTGSIQHSGGVLPGTITGFSSRGPSALDPGYFPDIMAPGENIRSSVPGSGYQGGWSGTSMAGPHVVGLIGLLWSANPALRGLVDTTVQIIKDTAVPLTGQQGSNCGGDYTTGPNNDWGYGTIDSLAAVQLALAFGGIGTLEGTVTNASTGDPIADVHIVATLSPTQTFQTTTNPSGYYSMAVFAGTYTVDATVFGYLPGQATGVVVAEDQTVPQDFELTPADSSLLHVTVVDANTGWPLYAVTTIGGTPWDPFWNNPVNGEFTVSIPNGSSYTLGVNAWTPGYLHQDVVVDPITDDTDVVVELQPDVATCNAPGYVFGAATFLSEDFEASNGGFTVSGNLPSWAWGAAVYGPGSAHSGTNVWATGLTTGSYNNNEDSYLTSPVIDLSSQAGKTVIVGWWQWLQVESGYDYGSVEVTKNGGASWTSVYGPVTGNIDMSWAQHSATLDPSYAVYNFQFRFHLTADFIFTYPGWYVDDVSIAVGECLPMTGGLVVGNVYDAGEGSPLEGATVWNDAGFSTETVATVDPNVADGFYVLFSPAGPQPFHASLTGYGQDDETVDVLAGDTVGQDFYLAAGHLTFDPLSMHVNLPMGSSTTQPLTITNDGSNAATFAITEQDKGFTPAVQVNIPTSNGRPKTHGNTTSLPQRVELSLSGSPRNPNTPVQTWMPSGPVNMVVDDGSAEDSIGLTAGGQFVWLNRFTPDPGLFPFTLDTISVLFNTTVAVGDNMQLVIWEDTDGDGDPGTGANFLYSQDVTVQINDLATWNDYTLATPVVLNGPGDVLVGVVNRSGSTGYADYPAAIDQDSSQSRSWLGSYSSGNPPNPPTLPADALWGIIDSFGLPGNWTLRASGFTGGGAGVPWLSEQPITGTIPAGLLATASPAATLISEGFEGGVVPPAGWTLQSANPSWTWQSTTDAHSGSFGAFVPWDYTQDEWLVSPEVDLDSGVLSFWSEGDTYYCRDEYNNCDLNVWIVVGDVGGGDDIFVGTADASWPVDTWAWAQSTFDLTPLLPGGPVRIGFQYVGNDGWDVALDDILLESASAANNQVVTVTFDAGVPEVTQPGDYLADLKISSDTPYPATTIPVIMTVIPPDTYGKLEGTVQGLGYCDSDPAPLNQAVVYIEGSTGMTWTLETDASGYYQVWMDQANTPVTMHVSAQDHVAQDRPGVVISGTQTTTENFDLRWLKPCVTETPASFDVAVDIGSITTTLMTLANTGAAATDFEVKDTDGGYSPAKRAGEDVLVVAYDTYSGSKEALEAALTANGVTYLEVAEATFHAMSVGDLLAYKAVFYVGSSDGTCQNLLMAYMDAGGSMFIADNDVGYYNGSTTFYTQYLQSTYDVDDGGSPLYGLDFMSGLTLDVSGDPYPDGFTVGPEGLEIFYWDGTGDAGGVAVNRNSYKALYLSFDFVYLTDAAAATDLIGRVMDFLAAGDATWLSEAPATGTLPADTGLQDVTLTFDASAVPQPGNYFATVQVKTADPFNGRISVPVIMTVNPTPGWGILDGTVTGMGYCDADPAPLEGATILITDNNGITYTVETDATGYYIRWLKVADGPYTVSVMANEHETKSVSGVEIPSLGAISVDFDLRWLKPCVTESPASLSVDLLMGATTTTLMTLENTGAAATTFELKEKDGGYAPSAKQIGARPKTSSQPMDLGYNPNTITTKGILDRAGTPVNNPLGAGDVLTQWPIGLALAWGTGFSYDDGTVWFSNPAVAGGDDQNHEYEVDGAATGRTVTAQYGGDWAGDMAYNQNTGTFWQVNVGGDNCLYEFDVDGGATGNAICGPWSTSERGVAYDPATDTYYVGGWNDLTVFHIDSAGGLIEQWNVGLSISGLAFNSEAGYLFIIENSPTDTVSVFDVATGTVISSFTIAGFGNYAGAGLEIDCDGNLWAANQADGNAYLIDSGVPSSLCASDVPWLSEDPTSGVLPADTGLQDVTVTFDSSVVPQPGKYFATLKVKTEDPVFGTINVPVTMTVNPTADYGILQGTVTSPGYCDNTNPPAPVEDATILIESASGVTYTVETAADGTYSRWLSVSDGPYIVSVMADDYEFKLVSGVDVPSQGSVVVDFDLRWAKPCVSTAPSSLVVDVPLGFEKTVVLDLLNKGYVGANFEITEKAGTPFANLKPASAGNFSAPAAIGPLSVRSTEGRAALASQPEQPATWNAGADIPLGIVRYAKAQCADMPDSFYVIGGVSNGAIIDQNVRYDAATDTWTTLAPFPAPQEGPNATCYEGYIYVVGGGGTNQFYIYDVANDTWMAGAALPRGVWGAAVGAYDGFVYMVGGLPDFSGTSPSNEVDIYDIASDAWISTGSPMPTPRGTAGQIQAGQYLYVVGGWGDAVPGANSTATERYDMSSDTWEVGPSFDIGLADGALAVTSQNVYAIGGDATGGGYFDATAAVYVLDHSEWPGGIWTDLGDPLPLALSANNGGFCTQAVTGGEVWNTGGFNNFVWQTGNDYRESEACFSGGSADVPWLSENPITGTITHDSFTPVYVTFTAISTTQAGGVYTASLIVKSDDPLNPRAVVPVTMNVIEPLYGVAVSPANQAGSGEPGTVVTYTVTVTNTSNFATDSYTVTLGTHGYDTGLGAGEAESIVVGPLGMGESATFVVTVHIPADAKDGDHDTVQITVTSFGDPSTTAIVNVTTNVFVTPPTILNVYMPLIFTAP